MVFTEHFILDQYSSFARKQFGSSQNMALNGNTSENQISREKKKRNKISHGMEFSLLNRYYREEQSIDVWLSFDRYLNFFVWVHLLVSFRAISCSLSTSNLKNAHRFQQTTNEIFLMTNGYMIQFYVSVYDFIYLICLRSSAYSIYMRLFLSGFFFFSPPRKVQKNHINKVHSKCDEEKNTQMHTHSHTHTRALTNIYILY